MKLLLALILSLALNPAFGAGCTGTGSCFWVGGTGNTSNTARWATASGGAVTGGAPSATDDCFFDGASGTGTATINSLTCKSVIFSTTNITLAGAGNATLSGGLTAFAGMTWTHTGALVFNATSSTYTITSNGVALTSVLNFNGVGGSWMLGDNLTLTGIADAVNAVNVVNGTFSTNGKNLTTPALFRSTGTGTRTVDISNSLITLTGGGLVWAVTGTGATVTANAASKILMNNASASSKTFQSIAFNYGDLELAGAGSGTFIVNTTGTFGTFTISTPPHTVQFVSQSFTASTYAISGTAGNVNTINSSVPGTRVGIVKSSSTPYNASYISFTDIAASPGFWLFCATGCTNGGNNAGISFLSPANTATLLH